jgi:hypothetical protein
MLMRTFLGKISLSALLVVFVGVSITLGGEDLIPPTRTLEGRVALTGRLRVVSEPPELEVFLDGVEIGQTPVWLNEVKQGFHKLQVQESETDVFVEPGRTVTVSYFKGSFIDVPREQEVVRQPRREPRKSTERRKRTIPRKGEERGDALTPFDWFLIFDPHD